METSLLLVLVVGVARDRDGQRINNSLQQLMDNHNNQENESGNLDGDEILLPNLSMAQ